MSRLEEFQEKIGYHFAGEGLLRQALTHSSYANERHMRKHADNERLEFLGDAVLEIVSSDFLYRAYPDKTEGDLTKLRASLVCEPTLALCTRELRLGDYLFIGRGEESTGGRERDSVLSDALEAVIGAIYLDGGISAAGDFIRRFILTDIEHKKLFHDCKTSLQEVVQAQGGEMLSYRLVGEEGPDHDKRFTAEALVGGRVLGRGTGRTKKAAEQEAAYQSLMLLRGGEKDAADGADTLKHTENGAASCI